MSDKDDDNLGSFYMGRTRPPPAPPGRVLPRGLLTGISVCAFAALIWYAYPRPSEENAAVDVPVITADTSPYKSAPEDPGGMEVPHRDSTVFEAVDRDGTEKQPEKILSQKEEPIDRDTLVLDDSGPELNLEPQLDNLPAPDNEDTESATPIEEVKATPPAKEEKEPEPKKEEVKAEKAPAPAKPTPKPAPSKTSSVGGGGIYIQLGAFKGETEAIRAWSTLQKKYPALAGLSMRTQKADLGAKGTFYRLQAGANSAGQAKDICAALQSAGAACIVVK